MQEISGSTDDLSGEQIAYTCDVLNRLIKAGTTHSQSQYPSACLFATGLQLLYHLFPDQRYTYGFAGNNTNSFTRTLLNGAGMSVPFLTNLKLSFIAPGWQNPLPRWW
jgi:hypothetical protein